MEPNEKPRLDIKRVLITAAIVLLAAGIVGGTTWYVMDKSEKEIKTANDESVAVLQRQIDELKTKTTSTTTTGSSTTTNSGTITTETTKGALVNTYTNTDCAFTLNYPTGFTVTKSGASNAIISSANFYAIDHGFNVFCSGGDVSLIKSYGDYSTDTLAMKTKTNSDGSVSYYEPSNGGKLIIITFEDPNNTYQTLAKQILNTLKLN